VEGIVEIEIGGLLVAASVVFDITLLHAHKTNASSMNEAISDSFFFIGNSSTNTIHKEGKCFRPFSG